MSDTLVTDALAWYARHSCALFPIPYGSKAPFGIVGSFAHDHSSDPAQWASWKKQHNCNFGLVAGPSRLVIVDVDVAEVGREVAWRYWSEWCESRDLPIFSPSVQSARGGWHIAFSLPEDLEISTLRQCPLVGAIEGVSKKAIIDLRVGNGFVVAAGSYYDGTAKGETSGEYILMSDAPPHPAPAALLAACARAAPRAVSSVPGSRDRGDVAALLRWMADKDMFSSYDDWLNAGLALKIEYGDDALDLWEICHDSTVTADVLASKWQSFATDPLPGMTTLNSLLSKAHAAGWRGTVRKSTSAMFDGVAQLAAMSGASLSSGMPTPTTAGLPMMAGQQELARLAAPILQEFLAATADTPPPTGEFPALPVAMDGHGLYGDMQSAIARVVALTSAVSPWKPARVTAPLAVLSVLHADVYSAVVRHVETAGRTVYTSKIKLAAAALADNVERAFVSRDAWVYDQKTGQIEHDNPDNFVVFLGIIDCEVRFNAWLERMEIRGGNDADLRWPCWTYIDDTIVTKLRMRALRTKTRFKIGKDFAFEALLALAHTNQMDPVVDLLASLESEWDGTPRLSSWLATYCSTPDDDYHTAVGRSLIGGMVTRIRQPGVKFDTMPIFFGRQGTGKSTMLSILALKPEYFSDSILLGDASKELVLSLAGKTLVEISEMGMRGNTNVAHVKAMISRTTDAGRTAYARAVTERDRRNIWAGSTNEEKPLMDSENRRFLPVGIDSEIDLAALRRDVFQLVGEAAALHSAGTSFSIPRDVWATAAEHQEAARSVSDLEARLSDWFAETPHTQSAYVTTADLGELAELAGWKGQHSLRNAVLRRLGFRDMQCYVEGKKAWVWYRGVNAMGKHVAAATRYTVGRDAAGRVRVGVKVGAVGVLPPLPY